MNIFTKSITRKISRPAYAIRTLINDSVSVKEKKIGIIGMGNVGTAVANNLLRNNYKLTSIIDIEAKKCEGYPCKVGKTAREVVEDCDVIVSALPKPVHIKQAFEGPDGMLAGMSPGKIWIDHSTTDFKQTEEQTKVLEEKQCYLLESPITGGLEALRKGQMTVLVAGNKDAFDHTYDLQNASYQTVLYTGGAGSALIPKVISNMLCAMVTIAAGEALVVCKKAGMDVKHTYDIIRATAGNSFAWETAVPMIAQGDYGTAFTLDLFCKDNQLMHDIARQYNVPIELMSHVQQMYNRALAMYGPDAPCYSPAKIVEDATGVRLQDEGFKNWEYSVEDVDGSLVVRHDGIETKRTGHPMPK
ncbi:2-hydroxy-3-oxopropionate reductase-like [Clytia hemisphaerica]|uniref:3-hydroxyisobutyrate dehydrogenase n=1 Tax=Clytia hemisphaerica TaxID=252671 RepID=A0A7M5V5M6_9CNID